MDYKKFIRNLVDIESAEERMALAEDHMETFSGEGGEDLTATVEELTASVEALTQKVAERDATIVEKDKKFKDRFFGSDNDETVIEDDDATEILEEEDEPTETKTLSDLGFTKNGRG